MILEFAPGRPRLRLVTDGFRTEPPRAQWSKQIMPRCKCCVCFPSNTPVPVTACPEHPEFGAQL